MALLESELRRIRFELGYNVLNAGAEPYIGTSAVFDQVIAGYMQAGAVTTSSTAVAAVTPPAASAPVAITLADATGFHVWDKIWLDVDARQESATVQAITGNVVTVMLAKAHTGTYPVTVEGGEAIVRECLAQIAAARKIRLTSLGTLASAGLLKRADEVEWYQLQMLGSSAAYGSPGLAANEGYLRVFRNELASALGVENLWELRRDAGRDTVLY